MQDRAYGDWYAKSQYNFPTKKECEAAFPTQMKNDLYASILKKYLLCVTLYLNQYSNTQILEKQAERLDIDTICAYELYQMKSQILKHDVIEYRKFVDEKVVSAQFNKNLK